MKPAALGIRGDARHLPLPDNTVQSVVTSPPYWSLRNYGLPPLVWDDPGGCEHERWIEVVDRSLATPGTDGSGLADNGAFQAAAMRFEKRSAFCRCCSAWRGSLGLEPTPEMYVRHLVEIFREVLRVLRDDGTVWLNLGDGYSSGDRSTYRSGTSDNMGHLVQNDLPRPLTPLGLKPKDLLGMPWRVAFALQADGWWLRSDIIWSKPNPMPESVTDRPTKSHEYLFLLSKSERYYYDAEAIKEPALAKNAHDYTMQGGFQAPGQALHSGTRGKIKIPGGWDVDSGAHGIIHRGGRTEARYKTVDTPNAGGRRQAPEPGEPNAFSVLPDGQLGRNKRTVWEIPTAPFPDAHFATFPQNLVKPCILAGTSGRGACARCGALWTRMTETTYRNDTTTSGRPAIGNNVKGGEEQGAKTFASGVRTRRIHTTLGWRPTCRCGVDETVPCIVLDPFVGSGTTMLVAQELGRVGIGVDLKGEYLSMAQKRTAQAVLL